MNLGKKSLAITLTLVFFFSASPILAACNPPEDYSDCPITQVGPKIAGNIDPKNYEQIRDEYNQADPSLTNQQIPVTVIYTTADLASENLENTIANLEAMKKQGLQPVIRISSSGWSESGGWGQISSSEAATSAQSLNQALSRVFFSQPPVVYFGNEPNLAYEWGGQADAQSFAESFASFIGAAGSSRQFKIFVPPMAGHQGGTEYEFVQQILNYQLGDGRTIAQAVDGAALTIYNDNPQSLSSLYKNWANFYQNNKINNLIISEIGPLVNGRLLQGQGDINEWTNRMSQVFSAIKNNPNLFGAQFIFTSFFLDTNGDGNPDVTLLVVIDKDGNITILNLASLGGGIITPITYGECGSQIGWEQVKQQAGRAFGEPFKVSVRVNPFEEEDPTEKLLLAIKSSQPEIEFPQNEIIAQVLSVTDKKLTPPNRALNLEGKTTQGKIAYIVCQENTYDYFVFDEPSSPDKSQDLQAPEWLELTKNTSGVLQKLLTKTKSQSNPPTQARASSPAVLGEGTSPEETKFFISIENTRIGDDGRLHYGIRITHTAPGIIGDVLINPEIGIHYENIPPGPGGAYIDTDYPGADQFLPTYPAGTNPDDIFVNIEVRDQSGYRGPKNPLPKKGVKPPEITPTLPLCTMKNFANGNWNRETIEVCVDGVCHVEKILSGSPIIIEEPSSLGEIIERIIGYLFGMEETFYIVTPITYTPYTMEIERNTRETSFKTFHLPNSQYPERENASSPVKYTLEGNVENEGPLGDDEINILIESDKTDIHTQKGTRDAYEYMIKVLTPPTPMPTP